MWDTCALCGEWRFITHESGMCDECVEDEGLDEEAEDELTNSLPSGVF